jgi:hypothetical protein
MRKPTLVRVLREHVTALDFEGFADSIHTKENVFEPQMDGDKRRRLRISPADEILGRSNNVKGRTNDLVRFLLI